MTQSVEASKFSPLATVLLLAVILAVSVAVGCAAWWLWSGAQPLNERNCAKWYSRLFRGRLCFVIAILIWHTFLSGVRKLAGVADNPAAGVKGYCANQSVKDDRRTTLPA
ncbi:hypothetical protein ABVN23_29340, partial [Pseudomonas fluorescens]|uniref:hypothetical protein n=1 Tax=Pseudomonas fluorescens TaxID=294 RepID=UPI003F9AF4D4